MGMRPTWRKKQKKFSLLGIEIYSHVKNNLIVLSSRLAASPRTCEGSIILNLCVVCVHLPVYSWICFLKSIYLSNIFCLSVCLSVCRSVCRWVGRPSSFCLVQWNASFCNQRPKSTIKKKSPQTLAHLVNFSQNVSAMFDNHAILLF